MKTTLQVDDELLSKFQEAVVKRFGKLKGSQSEVIAEAMRLWLSYVGEVRCVRVIGGGMDTIQEFERLPDIVKNALESGAFAKSDLTAVPLFFRFTKEDLESLCRSFKSLLGENIRVLGRVEAFEGGGGVSFSWRLTNGGRLVLNCFHDTITVGVRVEEPNFKDLKV